jgi:hypothetical protein
MDDLRAMHSARLAGLTDGIAAPPKALMVEIADLIADAQAHIVRRKIAQAKRKRELARQRARERAQEQARIDRDPIVFGTDGTHTVVLGHYNTSENDPEELRSLVATLDTLAFDL